MKTLRIAFFVFCKFHFWYYFSEIEKAYKEFSFKLFIYLTKYTFNKVYNLFMKWLESNEFQRLLYFIYVWEIVDIRMIKKFQPYPKGRNWIQYLFSKEKWIKKEYRNCKNEKNHKWSGCVFKLTKKGCEEASFLWKLPKFKSNVSIITLQHNYICLWHY